MEMIDFSLRRPILGYWFTEPSNSKLALFKATDRWCFVMVAIES